MTEQARSAAEELDVHTNSQQGSGGLGKRKAKSKSIVIAAALVAVVVVAAITGCSAEKTKTVTLEWLSVEVPEDWTVEYEENEYEYLGDWEDITISNWDDEDAADYYYIAISGPFEIEDYETEFEDHEEYVEDSLSEDGYVVTSDEVFNEDDAIVQRISYAFESDDDNEYPGIWGTTGCYQNVYSGNEYIFIWCISEEEVYEDVLDSMTLENPSAPA